MKDVQPLADAWGSLTDESLPQLTHALRELNRLPGLRAIHKQLFDGLHLTPGARVLEVGCGPWVWERTLRSLVGDSGLLVGVDPYLGFLQMNEQGSLIGGDGRYLPFAQRSFDATFCSKVLTHVGPTEAFVNEMMRVTRRGGMLGAFEWTFSNWEIEDDGGEVSDAIHQSFVDVHLYPDIAIALPDLFRDLGLSGVIAVPYRERITNPFESSLTMAIIRRHAELVVTQQIVSQEAVNEWLETILERAEQGRFAFTRTGLAAWGKV